MAKNRFLFFVLALKLSYGFSQSNYYFVQFKDKDYSVSPKDFLSQKAIQRRQRQHIQYDSSDYPVDNEYIFNIKKYSYINIKFVSKWQNGLLIQCRKETAQSIENENFVKEVRNLDAIRNSNSEKQATLGVAENLALSYGNSLVQIQNLGVDVMHEEGITGKGVYVAVFDGGFRNANTSTSLSHLFSQNRIKYTANLVDTLSVFDKAVHGTNVLSCLAGYAPGNLIGTGFDVDIALLISEDVSSERLIEEYNWLRAAEIADSLGVDIISSSLGYNTFDVASENHTLNQLDGNTSIITKAANMAAQKGILVVSSGGNNYSDPQWRNIVFPNDAIGVLAVGAANADGTRASFSAIGPTADGRVKPDVVALGVGVVTNSSGSYFSGSSGTSYSAPLVAGLAAGLWQLDTTLTNMQLLEVIKQSANKFYNQDNQTGAGIPNYSVAYQLIQNCRRVECQLLSGISMYPNPVSDMITFDFGSRNSELNSDYQLFDVSGQEIMAGIGGNIGNQNFKLDLSSLQSGVYFLKVDQKIHKIVKL